MARNFVGSSSGLKVNNKDVLKGKQYQHGFPVPYEVSLSYNSTTRTITLTPTGPSFKVWLSGLDFDFTGVQTFPAHPDVTGEYYFTYDQNGGMGVSSTLWDLLGSSIPVCSVYYNSALKDGIALFELHSSRRNVHIHKELHYIIGSSVKKSSDFTMSGYVLNAASSNADVNFSLTSGTVFDEDIEYPISALASGQYTMLYRTGVSDWTWSTSPVPYLFNRGNTSNIIQYNQNNAGSYQLTNLAANDYMNYFVCATTAIDQSKQILLIPGQVKFATLSEAQAVNISTYIWGTLPVQEICPVYQIIMKYKATNNTSGRAEIAQIRRLSTTGSAMSVSSGSTVHNVLTGRDDPDCHTTGAITNFTQDVKTAVGSALTNTQTANMTFDGVAQTIKTDVRTQMSVTSDASGLKLVNDSASPGAYKAFSTNSSGVKGWGSLSYSHISSANTGRIPFSNGSVLIDDSGLTWDNAGKILHANNLNFTGVLYNTDAKTSYGKSLTTLALVADSTKWYRAMTLPGSYCSYVDLVIQVPTGHSVYRVRMSKATSGNGMGWTVDVDVGGIYNYVTGNIIQMRVVDGGPNAETHLDVKFNGNATRDIRCSILNEVGSTTGNYATLVGMTDQGTAAAGTVIDLGLWGSTTVLGTQKASVNAFGGIAEIHTQANVTVNRIKMGGVDFISGVNTGGNVTFGSRSTHPINVITDNTTRVTIEADGRVSYTQSINFGSRLGQHINLYSNTFGMGIQNSTAYLRTASMVSFHIGGVHSDAANDPGTGGTEIMRVDYLGSHLGPSNSGNGNTAWYRSYGNTGWFNSSYGGGWYMMDTTFIRVYGSKTVMIQRDWEGLYGNLCLLGNAPRMTLIDTDDYNKWLFGSDGGNIFFHKTTTNGLSAADWVQKFQFRSDGMFQCNGLAGSGNRALYADPNGFLVTSASDERLKENFRPVSYGLKDVLKVKTTKFNWKDKTKRGPQDEIGCTAQNIFTIFPELVGESDDGTKTLDYAKMVVPLVEAIKELNTIIGTQADSIRTLQNEVTALKAIIKNGNNPTPQKAPK